MTQHEWEMRMQTAVLMLNALSAKAGEWNDQEMAHVEADKILLAAVSPEVAEAYAACEDRHGGFWYA